MSLRKIENKDKKESKIISISEACKKLQKYTNKVKFNIEKRNEKEYKELENLFESSIKSIKVVDFTNIELSLKALKQVIVNQISFSEANYIWASDIAISLDFINSLKETLKLMEKLFGSLNEQQNACYLINGKIVDNF